MKEKIATLCAQIDEAMQQTETGRALYELKVKFQTELKGIMSGMKDLPKEERPAFGKIVNEFKQSMEEKFEARAIVVRDMEMQQKYAKERIDITMPGKSYKTGALHPITLVQPSASCYERHPHLNKAFSEVGVALALFTLSSMPNQQSDWAWGELLLTIHYY